MKRFEDWPTLLDQFLLERKSEPFVWGKNDCCLFACDAVLRMTGIDLAKDFRGKYDSQLDAMKAIKKFGAKSVGDLADTIASKHGIVSLVSTYAQRGDVALLDLEYGESLGIVSLNGCEIWVPGTDKIEVVPTMKALRAWRI